MEINTTLKVAENLGKIEKTKLLEKILVIETPDVSGAQFVNLQIFTFAQVEKKLPIYFSFFPSMIKSSIYTNGFT